MSDLALRQGIRALITGGITQLDDLSLNRLHDAVVEEKLDRLRRDSPPPDPNRCAWCGRPVVERIEDGCIRGNCAQRPLPVNLYDEERASVESNRLFFRSFYGVDLDAV